MKYIQFFLNLTPNNRIRVCETRYHSRSVTQCQRCIKNTSHFSVACMESPSILERILAASKKRERDETPPPPSPISSDSHISALPEVIQARFLYELQHQDPSKMSPSATSDIIKTFGLDTRIQPLPPASFSTLDTPISKVWHAYDINIPRQLVSLQDTLYCAFPGCQKTREYASYESLRQHFQTIHLGKSFACGICFKYAFLSKDRCVKHSTNMHGGVVSYVKILDVKKIQRFLDVNGLQRFSIPFLEDYLNAHSDDWTTRVVMSA